MWSYGVFLFLTIGRRYCPSRDVRSTNRALTCSGRIHTSWWQLWSVGLMPRVSRGISNAPCMRICHSVSEPGGLMKRTHGTILLELRPGFHNGVGPCGIGKCVLANASSVLSRRWSSPECHRHAAPLNNKFFPIPRFLESWLLIWSDIMVK